MTTWPLGVFASIDAGLGVRLEVAHELGVPTVQLHAPQKATRTKQQAEKFLARLQELGIRISVVFGGFEGESYADIPTVVKTVGLVPPATRAARLIEMKEIADFAKLLGVGAVGLLLAYEHSIVSPRDLRRMNAAFFTMNGCVSIAMLAFVAVDVFL